MAATVRGRLGGAEVPIMTLTAGAAVAKGDLLVFSSGKVIKATGGNNAVAVLGVAVAAAAADGDSIQVYPLMPDVLVSIPVASGDTINDGATYGLDATTLELSDDEASTYHRVRVWKTDPAASGSKLCTTTGWAVMA